MGRSKRLLTGFALGLFAVALAEPAAAAGPMETARRIVTQGKPDENVQPCQVCHGKNGRSSAPNFPHLAGQYRDYMIQALRAYREGERQDPIMSGQAKGLTAAEIQALAGYFASRTPVLATLPLQ